MAAFNTIILRLAFLTTGACIGSQGTLSFTGKSICEKQLPLIAFSIGAPINGSLRTEYLGLQCAYKYYHSPSDTIREYKWGHLPLTFRMRNFK